MNLYAVRRPLAETILRVVAFLGAAPEFFNRPAVAGTVNTVIEKASRNEGTSRMVRVLYQNLQRVGQNSPNTKWPIITEDLRNFYVTYPEYCFFVEFGTSNSDEEFKKMGEDIFAPARCSSRWGFTYDYCDPHATGRGKHKGDELFAVFKADKNSRNRSDRTAGLMQSEIAISTRVTGHDTRRNEEQSFGTRHLGVSSINLPATNKDVGVFLIHPSPQNAQIAVYNYLEYINQKYCGQQFIVVGDFNVRPTDRIGTAGKKSFQNIDEAMDEQLRRERHARAGICKMFDCCRSRRGGHSSITMTEMAQYFKLQLKSPWSDTHRTEGVIDYLMHTSGVSVTTPGVLSRTKGGSDHSAIYFDVS